VNETLPLPTDGQATADARKVLLSIGVNANQLGTPHIERAPDAVSVEFPMVIDGVVTDQYSQISYGHGATVLTAIGIITTATPAASYPTVSATQAVSELTQGSGGSTFGGSGAVTGGNSSDAVNVDINEATLGLATYVLVGGTSWLLPNWSLSGPETGSPFKIGAQYGGSVLAISAKYVHPQNSIGG
jgi:hypothetical protein